MFTGRISGVVKAKLYRGGKIAVLLKPKVTGRNSCVVKNEVYGKK